MSLQGVSPSGTRTACLRNERSALMDLSLKIPDSAPRMTVRTFQLVTGAAVLLLASCSASRNTSLPKATPLPPPVLVAEAEPRPLSCPPPNCLVTSNTDYSTCDPVYYEEGFGTATRWIAAECRQPSSTDDFDNSPIQLIFSRLVDPQTIRSTTWESCGYDGLFSSSAKGVRPLECRLNPESREFEWRYGKGHQLSKRIAQMKREDERKWQADHPVEHLCGAGQIDGYYGEIGSWTQTCEGTTTYLPNEFYGGP